MKSINYVRKELGVTAQTIRNYIKEGKIKAIKSPSGRYLIEEDELNRFLGKESLNNDNSQVWAFYLRSSSGDKVLLNNQENNLKNNYPTPKYIFRESGSGLNENRVQLNRLITKVKSGEITDVAVTQKDRLSRFGFFYLKELLQAYNVNLHVLYKTNQESNLQDELMKDFMSLIASFSGKFYRLRSMENKIKLLDKAKEHLYENNESKQ